MWKPGGDTCDRTVHLWSDHSALILKTGRNSAFHVYIEQPYYVYRKVRNSHVELPLLCCLGSLKYISHCLPTDVSRSSAQHCRNKGKLSCGLWLFLQDCCGLPVSHCDNVEQQFYMSVCMWCARIFMQTCHKTCTCKHFHIIFINTAVVKRKKMRKLQKSNKNQNLQTCKKCIQLADRCIQLLEKRKKVKSG